MIVLLTDLRYSIERFVRHLLREIEDPNLQLSVWVELVRLKMVTNELSSNPVDTCVQNSLRRK
jgi:hypothetical protein